MKSVQQQQRLAYALSCRARVVVDDLASHSGRMILPRQLLCVLGLLVAGPKL